jgi:hypothetical protein
MSEWLSDVPFKLFLTVAPLQPFGTGTYRWLLGQAVAELEDLAAVMPGAVGALGFTQPNQRGGMHLHSAVHGGDELLAVRRVPLARLLQDRWAEYQAQHLDYELDQRVRVDLQAIRSSAEVLPYCVRYASRSTSGDMFEVGKGLDRCPLRAVR